jgi:hypothetical protein
MSAEAVASDVSVILTGDVICVYLISKPGGDATPALIYGTAYAPVPGAFCSAYTSNCTSKKQSTLPSVFVVSVELLQSTRPV